MVTLVRDEQRVKLDDHREVGERGATYVEFAEKFDSPKPDTLARVHGDGRVDSIVSVPKPGDMRDAACAGDATFHVARHHIHGDPNWATLLRTGPDRKATVLAGGWISTVAAGEHGVIFDDHLRGGVRVFRDPSGAKLDLGSAFGEVVAAGAWFQWLDGTGTVHHFDAITRKELLTPISFVLLIAHALKPDGRFAVVADLGHGDAARRFELRVGRASLGGVAVERAIELRDAPSTVCFVEEAPAWVIGRAAFVRAE